MTGHSNAKAILVELSAHPGNQEALRATVLGSMATFHARIEDHGRSSTVSAYNDRDEWIGDVPVTSMAHALLRDRTASVLATVDTIGPGRQGALRTFLYIEEV